MVVAVGEMESSPYAQKVVASLGHLVPPGCQHMLGITLSKSKFGQFYLLEKQSTQLGEFAGPVKMMNVTTATTR